MKNRSRLTVFICFFTCIMIATGIMPVQSTKADDTETIKTVGDINGDNEINAKDVTMLRRYLAGGWGVTVNAEDADINGDDEVNAKDVTMLRRYLAGGWGVELSEKKQGIAGESGRFYDEETERLINEAISEMDIDEDDKMVNKVAKAYNWMALNIEYGFSGASEGHYIADVIHYRSGVCQGQALLFWAFMDKLDIECIYVSSEKQNHAWNMVHMDDGYWYYIDVTWGGFPNAGTFNTYYLLRNENGFPGHYTDDLKCTALDHFRDVPEANGVYYEQYFPHFEFPYKDKEIEFDNDGILRRIGDTEFVFWDGLMINGGRINVDDIGRAYSSSEGDVVFGGNVEYTYDSNRRMVGMHDYDRSISEDYEYNESGNLIKTVYTNHNEKGDSFDVVEKTVIYGEDGLYKQNEIKKYRGGSIDSTEYFPNGKKHITKDMSATGSYRISEYDENGKLIKTEYNDGTVANKNGYTEEYEYVNENKIESKKINSNGTFLKYKYYPSGKTHIKEYNNIQDVEVGAYYVEEYSEDSVLLKQEYFDGTEENTNGYVSEYQYNDDGEKELTKTFSNGDIYIISTYSGNNIRYIKNIYTSGGYTLKEYYTTSLWRNRVQRYEVNDGTSNNKDGYVEEYEYLEDGTGYSVTTTYTNGDVVKKDYIY